MNAGSDDSKDSDMNENGLSHMIDLPKNGKDHTIDAGICVHTPKPPTPPTPPKPPKKNLPIDLELTKTANKTLITSSEHLRFSKYLTRGSRGEEVKNVQRFLTEQGLYNGPISGYYGPLTTAAVKKFQNKHADRILKP
jgi:hypothetical protein